MSSNATPPSKLIEQPSKESAGQLAASAMAEGRKQPAHPAKLWQMVVLCIWLVGWMSILLWQISVRINQAADEAMAEVSVVWKMPLEVSLNSGPAAFRYDAERGRLVHHGVITPERRLELRALLTLRPPTAVEQPAPSPTPQATGGTESLPTNRPAPGRDSVTSANETSPPERASSNAATLEAFRPAYNEAIDTLTFFASTRQGKMIGLLLLLGGLGGALGAILRSLVDFVGHACYTGRLDLVRWWPLYFTRPIVGWILGFVLVVMFKARFLTPGEATPTDDSLWWLGMAVLGGFSTVDVTQRLRLGAKALFGVESNAAAEGADKQKKVPAPAEARQSES